MTRHYHGRHRQFLVYLAVASRWDFGGACGRAVVVWLTKKPEARAARMARARRVSRATLGGLARERTALLHDPRASPHRIAYGERGPARGRLRAFKDAIIVSNIAPARGCANCATAAMIANSAIPGEHRQTELDASLSSSRGWGLMSPPRPSSRSGSARATMPVCRRPFRHTDASARWRGGWTISPVRGVRCVGARVAVKRYKH